MYRRASLVALRAPVRCGPCRNPPRVKVDARVSVHDSCVVQTRPYSLKLARAASALASLRKPPSQVQRPETVKQSAVEQAEPKPLETLPLTNLDDRKVNVGWDPQTWSRFHHIWLRDHCRCPQCFHSVTKQRLVDTFEIPADIKPLKVEATTEGLKVIWPSSEAHVSVYPWQWLRQNSYDPRPASAQQTSDKVLWGAKIVKSPPTVAHDAVMENEKCLLKLLEKIDTFGFCLVSGVPSTPEATEELSKRIGPIRETHYGGFWDFTSDLAKGDTAYTTMALKAHTDTTYFTDPCGLQIFHLLSHTEGSGGASLLVDGFYVASILKELHPDVYELLSNTRISSHSAGTAGYLFRPSPPSGYPILNHDPLTGQLAQVRYNNDDRSVLKSVDANAMEQWYHALRTWNTFLSSPDSEYWLQLTPGTTVVIDNHRVLHGRSAFDGKRRMCGAYIGVDDFRSKLAILKERYAAPPATSSPLPGQPIAEGSVWSPNF